MGKTFFKHRVLFFYFILFLFQHLIEKSNASSRNELNHELSIIYQEIELLKDENQNQNFQIEKLKELVGFPENDQSQFLVKQSEDEKFVDNLDHQHKLHKRPVRLLPISILYGEQRNISAYQINRFFGPPRNCSELSQLGYTLNGYYHVKSANISDNNNQLETVFCSFKQPDGSFNPSGMEKRVSSHITEPGQNSGVHFYALLQSFNEIAHKTVIKFNDVKLNKGDGFDSKSGLFTAPKSGLYQFFFKGSISKEEPGMYYMIVLYWNQKDVGLVNKFPNNPSYGVSVIQAILELKSGDTVRVETTSNAVSFLSSLSFSGSLLEELQ